MIPKLLNGANLAYIGDAYYELRIRKYLIDKEITNQNKLHKLATKYVSESVNKKIINNLFNLLTKKKLAIKKQEKNLKSDSRRKNTKKDKYLASSGFESLIEYLYLNKNHARLKEIIGL